jgi:hypothetical protein
MRKPTITDAQDERLTALLIAVLEAHKSGEIDTRVAVSGIQQIIAAVDADEGSEFEAWLNQQDLRLFRIAH